MTDEIRDLNDMSQEEAAEAEFEATGESPEEEQNAENRVHFSRLKLLSRSPAHYLAAQGKNTYAMERGSALHSLILGGAEVIAYPGKQRRGKDWESFKADHPGAIILTRTESSKTFAMAASVRSHKLAMSVLEGQHEVEVDWTFLGRDCQSHVDVIGADYVTELKSTADAQPDRFNWHARRMWYLAQLAFYDSAVRTKGLCQPKAHYIVAVESAPPFVVEVFKCTERAIEHGHKTIRLWFERLLSCESARTWPGYCQSIVPLDVPEEEDDLIYSGSGEVAEANDEESVPF